MTLLGTTQFKFGKYDFGKMLTVALWSGGSAVAYSLLDQFTVVDWSVVLGEQYAVVAVALLNVLGYAVKQFFVDSRRELKEVPAA